VTRPARNKDGDKGTGGKIRGEQVIGVSRIFIKNPGTEKL